MSAIRKLVFACAVAGFTLSLPLSTEAGRRCPTGPTCTPVSSSTATICNAYCQQQGLIWDYCNTSTGCCVCSVS